MYKRQEYSRWTESIVGSEVINGAKTEDTASESSDTENEKAVFLLEGKFYDDTSIQMAECDTDLPDGDVVYAYNWSLEHLHDKKYDTVKAHFYVDVYKRQVYMILCEKETKICFN